MEARKKKSTKEKYKFATCVLSTMKLSIEHRKSKGKDKKKKIKDSHRQARPERDEGEVASRRF